MRTMRFLSVACVSLALATTFFACSSDDDTDGGGGFNLADLPKEVYLYPDMTKYGGSGNVTLSLVHYSIPDVVSSSGGDGGDMYCTNSSGETHKCEINYDDISAGEIKDGQLALDLPTNIDSKYLEKFKNMGNEGLTAEPKDLTGIIAEKRLYADISGESCRLRLVQMKSGEPVGEAIFAYASEAGKVQGENIPKGWSLFYFPDYSKDRTLEWQLQCNN